MEWVFAGGKTSFRDEGGQQADENFKFNEEYFSEFYNWDLLLVSKGC